MPESLAGPLHSGFLDGTFRGTLLLVRQEDVYIVLRAGHDGVQSKSPWILCDDRASGQNKASESSEHPMGSQFLEQADRIHRLVGGFRWKAREAHDLDTDSGCGEGTYNAANILDS